MTSGIPERFRLNLGKGYDPVAGSRELRALIAAQARVCRVRPSATERSRLRSRRRRRLRSRP